MKRKKLITFALSLFFMASNSVLAKATNLENPQENQTVIGIEEALNSSELNKFTNDEESLKALNSLKEDAVSSTQTEYYLRSITDSEGITIADPKQYTEEEYNAQHLLDKYDFDNNKFYENSWIKLKLETYKLANGDYNVYMFYNWKTKPMLMFHDVIGLSYHSTFAVDASSARSHHRQTIINPITQQATYSSTNHTSSEPSYFKSNMNGLAFKFDLPSSPDTWPAYYEGYLNVKGGFTGSGVTASTLEISYIHQQLSLPYNIQDAIDFLSTGKIQVKIAGGQDEFRFADRFKRY